MVVLWLEILHLTRHDDSVDRFDCGQMTTPEGRRGG